MKRWLVAVLALSMSGCAAVDKTYGPDGQAAMVINCSGPYLSWAACFKKAGDGCGTSGYNVLAVNGERSATLLANPQAVYGVQSMNRVMEVACKAP